LTGKSEEVRPGISVKVVARQSSQMSAPVATSTPKVNSADELRPQQPQVTPLGSGPLPASSPPLSTSREDHGAAVRSEDPEACAIQALQRAADVGDVPALVALLPQAVAAGVRVQLLNEAYEKCAAVQLQAWQDQKARLASERLKTMMEREEESAEALRTTAGYASELGASEDQLQIAHRRVSKLEKENRRQSSSMSGTSPCKPKASPAARVFASADLPTYGLDAELQAKAAAKYDANMEEEAAQWIQAITGTTVVGDFFGALCTGEVLCHLVNTIRPGTVPKVNEAGKPFKERENISNFLMACRALGVQEYAVFSTDDLYEKKDLNSVVRCVHALGGALRRSVPEFTGPHFGVADTSKTKRDQKREFGQVTQTGGLCMAMERPHIDMTSNQIVRGGA